MKVPFLALLAGCLALASCAVTTVQTVAPRSYAVTAHGNVFQSRDDLQAAIDKRAEKLCGSAGYIHEGEGQSATQPVTSYYNGQPIQASAVLLTQSVRCKDSPSL